jgi:hypothetical protein
MSRVAEPYRYEREVEEFLRWSPHVRREPVERRPQDAGLFGASAPVEDPAQRR